MSSLLVKVKSKAFIRARRKSRAYLHRLWPASRCFGWNEGQRSVLGARLIVLPDRIAASTASGGTGQGARSARVAAP